MFRHHPVLTAITLVYLAAVLWWTLGPQPLGTDGNDVLFRFLSFIAQWPSLAWIDYWVVEFTANVGMFVPVGALFLLLLDRRRWWLAVLAGFAVTCLIESVQLFLPSRVSDPRDIVSNTTGAIVGVVAVLVITTPAALRRRRAARLAHR